MLNIVSLYVSDGTGAECEAHMHPSAELASQMSMMITITCIFTIVGFNLLLNAGPHSCFLGFGLVAGPLAFNILRLDTVHAFMCIFMCKFWQNRFLSLLRLETLSAFMCI